VGGVGDVSNVGATWAFAPVGAHDFNADSRSDVVWRNAGGDVAVWLMNGTQITPGPVYGPVSNIWSIVGQRDFNGDGNADLLWRDNGNTAMWFMNGNTVGSGAAVGSAPTTFGGRGRRFRRRRQRRYPLARHQRQHIGLADERRPGCCDRRPGNVPTTWAVVGTGDFNGDGNTDILWRDTSGNTAIWFMSGTTILLAPVSATFPSRGRWSEPATSTATAKATSSGATPAAIPRSGLANGAAVSSAGSLGNAHRLVGGPDR
jgi:hypothetical protein